MLQQEYNYTNIYKQRENIMNRFDNLFEDADAAFSQEEVLNTIAKLKLQHPLSDKDKLRLQRLQQKLTS
tara:strand:+ start:201 stop:407 length:207 start_codon:yes stop_codon:yes gene_type:complete